MGIPSIYLIDKIKIPVIGLGTWGLRGEECKKILETAFEKGYRLIDTAELYDNESEIGEVIKKSKIPREEVFIVTKVSPSNLSKEDVINSCEKSLKKIGTDYIDLYLIHSPNPDIALKETLRGFKELQGQGKIKNIGVSNFDARDLRLAILISKELDIKIVANQVEFNPQFHDEDLLEICNRNKIKLIAYSPLARGNLKNFEILEEIGKKYRKSPEQISLRWIYQKNLISIPKSSSEEHLEENLDIFDFSLNDEEMRKIGSNSILNKDYFF